MRSRKSWHLGSVLLLGVVAASAVAIPPPPGPLVPVVPEPAAPFPGFLPIRICPRAFDHQTTKRWAHVRGGWRGGDGDFSVALPGRRTLWLFGDSIVSHPGRGGYAFVRNAAVLQQPDGSLVTTAASAAGQNTVGFHDPPDQHWLWPGAGFMLGRRLWLFESEMRKSGPGFWGFQYERSWLFQMRLRGTRLTEVRRVALPADGVIWGAAVLKDGPWLDIFGVHDHQTTKHPHVARVLGSHPLGPWTYWDGTSWTAESTPHADWHGSVASEFSVFRDHGRIELVTSGRGLDAGVHTYSAPAVTGPWEDDGGPYKPDVPLGTFAYNPLVHSRAHGHFELSYNIASLDPDHSTPPTPDAMRPRFADVTGCI
jgi:hypothetical protein